MIDVHHDTIEIGKPVDWHLGEIFAIGVTMERAIDVRAGVRHHFNLADLEFRSFRVNRTRRFATEVVADNRRRHALDRNKPVFDGVAEINVPVAVCHVRSVRYRRMDEEALTMARPTTGDKQRMAATRLRISVYRQL